MMMLLQGFAAPVFAAPATKTITVTIPEGAAGQSTLTKTVTIPNLQSASVKSVSSGGNASLSISGNNITITAKGGSPTRQQNNPYKYSTSASDYRTSSTDSFASSITYSSGGYSGTLTKNGSSYVSSGSYSPADSKTVTDSRSTSPGGSASSLPASVSYNSGGYSGTLIKNGGATLTSGALLPADSKTVSKTAAGRQYVLARFGGHWWDYYATEWRPNTISYNSDGYSGTLTAVSFLYTGSGDVSCGPSIGESGSFYPGTTGEIKDSFWGAGNITYSGTVTKPESDTRVWTQSYSGTVTKPVVDTRVYRQNYSGTIYVSGTDYYYSYTVTLEYIDNQSPTISTTLPEENCYFSKINFVKAVNLDSSFVI